MNQQQTHSPGPQQQGREKFILWYIRTFMETYNTSNEHTAARPLFSRICGLDTQPLDYIHIGKGVVWCRQTGKKYWFDKFITITK